jgi:hypothetical protein
MKKKVTGGTTTNIKEVCINQEIKFKIIVFLIRRQFGNGRSDQFI